MNSDYETACENDRILKATLRGKQIIMYIYLAAVVIGVILFGVRTIGGESHAVIIMLLIWACGSIANLFDSTSMIRRFLGYIGNGLGKAINSHSIPMFIGSILGLALGTVVSIFIMGIASPILIIAYLIGILKVKKQIAENNEILKGFQAVNSQK